MTIAKLDEKSLPLLPMIREAVFGCEAHKGYKGAETLLARDINRICDTLTKNQLQ